MFARSFLAVILFFLSASTAGAVIYTYDYNENCNKIYHDLMALRLADAHKDLMAEQTTHPNNLMATYLADYEDCILLLLNCDKAEYEKRIPHLSARLDELEKGDSHSPWYRFCKAGIYMHWAIADVRLGSQYKAALNFKHAYTLLRENEALYPRFEYNTVFSGLADAVMGSLPGNYRWLAAIFGMSGDIRKGMNELAVFLNTHNDNQPLYAETMLYDIYLRFYLQADQKGAWDYLNSDGFRTQGNILNTFVKVNIALDYRHADAAIVALNSVGTDINPYPIFDYQAGQAYYYRGDTAAIPYFIRFLKTTKSEHYIKDTWQKMAFTWYVNGNMQKADYCRRQIAKQGTEQLDPDKHAQRFAERNTWPQRSLLLARLLTDGGYYDLALAQLQMVKEETLDIADKAEYNYRLGRIYEETATTGNTKQALAYYRNAMTLGKDRHEQFAARAALQTARMYEQQGMKQEALNIYHQCLDMPGHDFQNSIDQQAKAGINRLSGN